ncbi:glycosyltransferase family 4 protein [Mucilaginibacter sp. SP1R1]|uniref:glycosyltransferase family 4 protein n=1 Tax=Mucilaginibacter sp. SP1R1 TaxID=2723091 RepID=UPI0016200202|nr:glycosyltransferase family 4 protein [Mucilaginibacter sp. SP1R1]MBB6148303.1 glycosyltransferase involved in cell wall biosynthesis [Mucilaginibacter sp. SP1R1]
MKSTEVISVTTNLGRFGGAQKVLMDVHEGLRTEYDAKILGFQDFRDLHPKYGIRSSEYIRFNNPFYLNNKILIVHARNVMAFIMVLKRLFFLNTKILYVSHNVYHNHRRISFFPDDIISISQKVTGNLLDYFKLKNRRVRLIYNGIRDEVFPARRSYREDGRIVILYSARVNAVKRQLELVERLSGKLHPGLSIQFAGSGPDYEVLKEKCSGTENFMALGFVENVHELVSHADYLMLFSVQEGLPISLIEGIMHGKPLLVNDVGGNFEIGIPGLNGIALEEDWDVLAETLNGLISLPATTYSRMSRHSRERYETMFTYDDMVANYLNVIRELEKSNT